LKSGSEIRVVSSLGISSSFRYSFRKVMRLAGLSEPYMAAIIAD